MPNNNDWNELMLGLGGTESYKYLVEGGGTGFEAKMTGYRSSVDGSFMISAISTDMRTYFWSTDLSDADNAYCIEIGTGSIQAFPFLKSSGFCIRCILD